MYSGLPQTPPTPRPFLFLSPSPLPLSSLHPLSFHFFFSTFLSPSPLISIRLIFSLLVSVFVCVLVCVVLHHTVSSHHRHHHHRRPAPDAWSHLCCHWLCESFFCPMIFSCCPSSSSSCCHGVADVYLN